MIDVDIGTDIDNIDNIEIVELCQYQFGFKKTKRRWKKRVSTFNVKFDTSDNAFKLISLL